MTKKDFIRLTTCAAIFGLVGGVTFEGTNYIYNKNFAVESSAETSGNTKSPVVSSTSTGSSNSTGSVSDVAENVLPSIVAIDVTVTSTGSDMFGRTYSQNSQGSGSGIIVAQDDDNLYIATNNHVVSDASEVSVKFNDDKVYSAEVRGTDSDCDLAVVTIPVKDLSSDTLGKIKVAALGDSDKVKVGDQAIAIGNALGYGTSVTVGYISAKEREVSAEDMTMKLIQTDAAINPGNSGGALLNMQGQVIGINEAKYSSNNVEGVGYAIPISDVESLIGDLKTMTTRSEVDADKIGYLGINCQDVTEEISKQYDMPLGIYLKSVVKGCAADKAGLKKGDILTRFDGVAVSSYDSLRERLQYYEAGETVEVTVQTPDDDGYTEKTVSVTLNSREEIDAASK